MNGDFQSRDSFRHSFRHNGQRLTRQARQQHHAAFVSRTGELSRHQRWIMPRIAFLDLDATDLVRLQHSPDAFHVGR